jgi:hypothetical protein
VLVLRGESGAGKTASLDHVLHRASVAASHEPRASSQRWSSHFAGLHQHCVPMLERLERLPARGADRVIAARRLKGGGGRRPLT